MNDLADRLSSGHITCDWEAGSPLRLSAGRCVLDLSDDRGTYGRDLAFRVPGFGTDSTVRLRLVLPSDESMWVTPEGELRALSGEMRQQMPHARYLVTRIDDQWVLWDIPWRSPFLLRQVGCTIQVEAVVAERERCGLSVWGDDKLREPLRDVNFPVRWYPLDAPWRWPRILPYPGGAKSVLSLTDHPDFDDTAAVRTYAAALRDAGLRITKGVFPGSTPVLPGWDYGPGVDDPAYRSVIEGMLADGHEIAFHALGPSIEPPPIEECVRRIALLCNEFGATTWIDHGVGDYLISRRGAIEGVPLLPMLQAHGVESFWSYSDHRDNPLAGRTVAWARATQLRPSRLAYLALHRLRDQLGVNAELAVRTRPLEHAAWSTARSLVKAHRVGRRDPFVLYGPDGARPSSVAGEPWFFDTMALNHLAVECNPDYLASFIDRGEAVVAHTYIANRDAHAFASTFASDGSLSRQFLESVTALGELNQQGTLAVVPFATLRRSLCAAWSSSLVRTDSGWGIATDPVFGAPSVRLPHESLPPARWTLVRGGDPPDHRVRSLEEWCR